MKIVTKIEYVNEFPIYDLTVENDHCFELENGVIAHNSLFPKQIVSGGTGVYYSANSIFIIGRSQEKVGDKVEGWNFILNVEKSRYVKEKSKLTFQVMYDSGINKWSGLMDSALESGHCIKPSNGWYQRKGEDTKYRFIDTDNKEFWTPILSDPTFQTWIKEKYMLAGITAYNADDFEEEKV